MAIFYSPTGFLEILIFLCAAAAFVAAVRFFMDSRKRLHEAFPGLTNRRRLFSVGIDRTGFLVPKGKENQEATLPFRRLSADTIAPDKTKEEVAELRRQLHQQQKELSKVLQTLSASNKTLPSPGPAGLSLEVQHTLHDLQARLAAKETEVQQLRHHEAYAHKLQEQFEEVQSAFDAIQEKMLQMERHAWETAELNIQLEQAEQARHHLEMALSQKDEKLRELALENSHLREACNAVQTKLSSSDLHYQQLLRKVQLLEGLNFDFVEMAEAASKLKNGIARAAEMESLLQLINDKEQRK